MDYYLMPADTYTVINKANLDDHNREILTILYQPIIGSNAINLYFTLWNFIDDVTSVTLTHHNLMNIMHLSLEEIKDARIKLEAIGLVKTYIKEDSVNSYVYLLYSPLDAYKFLNNPILNTTLYNNLGKKEYQRIIKKFSIPEIDLKDYTEISSKFNDIFESKVDSNIITTNIKNTSSNDIEIKPSIDMNNILSSIPKDILNHRTVIQSMKDTIYKLSFVYNYNDEEMTEIIRNSINEEKRIDESALKKNAREFYKFEHLGKLPTLVFKAQPEYLRNKTLDTSPKAKMIYTFETTAPNIFLSSKINGKLSKNDVKILEMLIMDFGFNPGVVNVLIDYVLRINNNKLTENYVNVIASQWQKCNIKTVEEAMSLASQEYSKKRTTKKTVKKVDWLESDIKENIATEEEIRKFEESLKG